VSLSIATSFRAIGFSRGQEFLFAKWRKEAAALLHSKGPLGPP